MQTHVIVNARAARFAADEALVGEVAAASGSTTVHVTRTLESLDAACSRIARCDARLVVLCGGDGSAMAGTTALVRAFADRPLPAVCLAPGGNSCTIARNWGRLSRTPQQHVAQVLDRAASDRLAVHRRPTLRVTQNDGVERIGYIFGAGLVASFFEAFYERGGGGYAEASQMIARIFLGSFVGGPLARRVLEPTPCTLEIEGRTHPNRAFTLIVSSVVEDLGLRLRVTHRAAEDPKRPHLVASSLGLVDCGKQYGRVLTGKPLVHPRTVDQLAQRFCIRFPSKGAYVLDGDLLHTEAVTVDAGPEIRVASL